MHKKGAYQMWSIIYSHIQFKNGILSRKCCENGTLYENILHVAFTNLSSLHVYFRCSISTFVILFQVH